MTAYDRYLKAGAANYTPYPDWTKPTDKASRAELAAKLQHSPVWIVTIPLFRRHKMSADAKETGQTGQAKDNARPAYFEIAEDERKRWHWMLWSGTGRPLATNAVEYASKKDVMQAIRAFRDSVLTAELIVRT